MRYPLCVVGRRTLADSAPSHRSVREDRACAYHASCPAADCHGLPNPPSPFHSNSSQRNSELPASGVALSCTIDAAPRAQRRLAGKQRRRASGDGTSDWLERLLPAAYRTLGSASLHLATMHASSAPLRRVVARGLIMPRRRSVSLLRPCQPVHVTPAPHLLQRRRDRARHNGCLRVAGLSPIDVCNTHAAPDPHSPGGPPIARQLTGLLHSRRREATLDRPEGSREHARALPPLPLFSPSLDALRSLP